ncbi:MAG TPA: signal peptidase I [Candidatus Angelobacter sp.]|nr:signal peptidase I [Candidatus Angelobacter sp.]
MTGQEENVISSPEQNAGPVAGPETACAAQPPSANLEETHAACPPKPVASHAHFNGETLLQSLLSIIVIVLFVITFIVQAFQIPSESMEKTLLIGDYLLVDKVHFGQGSLSSWFLPYSPIKRGDIVVFHYPLDPSQHYVKRVIGLPGDRIRLHNKTVLLNDAPIEESYAVHVTGDFDPYRDNFPTERDLTGQVETQWRSELQRHLQNGDLVVPQDEYFVMGDNRDRSADSRYWGFVPRSNIVGRPLVIYLSVRDRQEQVANSGNGKLYSSGHLLAHVWQFARWGRMFRLVR